MVPIAERESGHKPTSLTLQMKNQFSLTEPQWVDKPLLKTNPMPSSRQQTQNELDVIFRGSLHHNAFSGTFILVALKVIKYILHFLLFLFLYNFCVCEYICMCIIL